MKVRFNGLFALAAAGVLAMTLAPRANATVEIRLTTGASTVTVVDGGAGDSCAAVNCVTFNGSLGAWIINVSTGNANYGAAPSIDLNSVDKTTTNAPALTIETTADGYTPSANSAEFFGGGTLNASGTYTFKAFGGYSNALFDETHQIGPTETFTTNAKKGASFSFDDVTPFSPFTVSPYSLTESETISFSSVTGGQGSSNIELDTTSVPEPAVVTLLGGVLLFTVGAVRRKARRS